MTTKLILGFSVLTSLLFCFSKTESNYLSVSNKLHDNEPQQPTPLQKSIANGKELYTELCIQCHMANGKGNGTTFPPLDGSDWLKKKRTESIHAVKYGQKGEIVVNGKKFNNMMPSPGLSNEEIADVMNYVMNSWSNKTKKMVTAKEVATIKP